MSLAEGLWACWPGPPASQRGPPGQLSGHLPPLQHQNSLLENWTFARDLCPQRPPPGAAAGTAPLLRSPPPERWGRRATRPCRRAAAPVWERSCVDAGPPSHQRLVWPLPARPRQPPANCAPKREGGVWRRCQLFPAPGEGRASRGRCRGGVLVAGSPRVSEDLVRASKDRETWGNFSDSQAARLEGILFHLILTAWDTARRAESDHPARSGRGPAANGAGVGAWGPASPMGAGSGGAGRGQGQTCSAKGHVRTDVPGGAGHTVSPRGSADREGRKEGRKHLADREALHREPRVASGSAPTVN